MPRRAAERHLGRNLPARRRRGTEHMLNEAGRAARAPLETTPLVGCPGAGTRVLLDLAVRAGAPVSALHVNDGLRGGADEDVGVRPRPLLRARRSPLRRVRRSSARSTAAATCRSARGTRAMRSPSASPPACMRPGTRLPIRPRPCSTGLRSRRARGRCTVCQRGGGGRSARCWG